jgi:hypothetical protein
LTFPDDLHCGNFENSDVAIYYSIIRHFKPNHIIEIDSGDSTHISAHAISKNLGYEGVNCDLVAIEPYPSKELETGFKGFSKL